MSDTPRAELTAGQKAVSETLDEVNFRMHGLTSSGSYHQQFVGWLGERGYRVVPAVEMERLHADRSEAAEALRAVGKAALVVKPTLDKPYDDDPSQTPWSRFMEAPARAAYNLGVRLSRKDGGQDR